MPGRACAVHRQRLPQRRCLRSRLNRRCGTVRGSVCAAGRPHRQLSRPRSGPQHKHLLRCPGGAARNRRLVSAGPLPAPRPLGRRQPPERQRQRRLCGNAFAGCPQPQRGRLWQRSRRSNGRVVCAPMNGTAAASGQPVDLACGRPWVLALPHAALHGTQPLAGPLNGVRQRNVHPLLAQ